MPNCIITGETITEANNSRAHIIPSALGGRLKPTDILSRNGNGLLGDKVDLPFIEAFQPFMTLLNGSRDRGKNQPLRTVHPNGRTLVVEFGEPLKLSASSFKEEDIGTGTKFEIEARTLREARILLGRVRSKYPMFDIDEALQHATTVREWTSDMLRVDLQIGPCSVFPALFASASIFAVLHGLQPHPNLKDYVSRLNPDEPIMPPDTFFFMPEAPWISTSAEVSHIVAMLPNPAKKQALVYFEVFNLSRVGVLLPYDGTDNKPEAYAVDLLTGAEVIPTIDLDGINAIPWAETHKLGDADFYRDVTERAARLAQLAHTRSFDAFKETLNARLYGKDDGDKASGDRLDAFAELIEFSLARWRHPLFSLVGMEDGLCFFDSLSATLIQRVPLSGRSVFMARYRQHRSDLSKAIETKKKEAST